MKIKNYLEKMGLFGKTVFSAACVSVLAAGLLHAIQQIDPILEAFRIDFLDSGSPRWRLEVDSSGRLFLRENGTINRIAVRIDDAQGAVSIGVGPGEGQLELPGYTSNQLGTLIAFSTRSIVYNLTTAEICQASGTVSGGAWVGVSTAPTAGDQTLATRKRCY